MDTRLRVARGIAKTETEASIEVFQTLKRRGHPDAPPPTVSDGWGGIDDAMVEVYGKVPEALQPISEDRPLHPINPYAASKASQEMFCYQYIHTYQLPIVMVRPFNHTGPRQVLNFVCPDFARQIAEIERGVREPVISVGNLEARRDFCDVRDIVRAYHLAIEECPVGTPMNIASGRAWSIQHVLDTLLQFSTVPIEVRQDPDRLRPSDVPLMLGDATRFYQHTSWRAKIDFRETLQSVLDYWRVRVAQ